MTLVLSPREQVLVANAMRTLVSPLLQPTIEDWLSEVNRTLKELLGADKASFMYPVDERKIYTVSDELSSPALQHYMREKLPEIDRRWGTRRRSLELGTFNRALIYGNRLGELYRSEYYNEYLVKHRAFDVLGLATGIGTPPRAVLLYFHHDRPTGRRFGRRGLAMSRMLYPAFNAGVHASQGPFAQRQLLTRLTDTIRSGIALADSRGRVLHRNTALQEMARSDPAWSAVEQELQASLRACLAVLPSTSSAARHTVTPPPPLRRARGSSGSYSVNAVPLDVDPRAADALVVVLVDRVVTPAFPERTLRARFRLTPREVEVARVLSDGSHNAALAARLGISEYTARHHTESVLLKLGLHARAQISCTLTQLAQDELLTT